MTQNNVGIYASQISGHLWAPNGAYDALATINVPSGGAATIEFSGIPQSYRTLQLRSIARDGGATNDLASFKIVFNGDTTTGYTRHFLIGNGSTASAGSNLTTGFAYNGQITQNGTAAGIFAATIMNIVDYASTSKHKTVSALGGGDLNGAGNILFASSLWQSTSGITSISITSSSSTNFAQYSQFALYGIK